MYIAHISDLHINQDESANLFLTKKLVTTINDFDILPDYTADLVHKDNSLVSYLVDVAKE